MMNNLLRLTSDNAAQHIGREIQFYYKSRYVVKTLNRVSPSGKTVYIDCPDVKNNLQLATRKVYLLAGGYVDTT